MINQFHPGHGSHLREIDSAKTHSRDKNIDPITQWLVLERIDSVGYGFCAVRTSPPRFHLCMRFCDGHLQRGVGHLKWYELLPVLRPRQPAGGLKLLVKRCRGQRREQTEDGQARRPGANLLKCPFRDSGRVVVHAKNEGSDRINVALGEPLEHGCILTRLVEPLAYAGKVRRVDGLHPDKHPLAARGCNEVHEFLIAQQIGADLGDPVHLSAGSDNVAQQRFRAFDIDGEIIVDEKDGDLAAFFFGARFQKEEFVDDAFVGAEADGVAEETGDGAKFAAIRATAAGLHGNDAECAPTFADAAEGFGGHFGDEIELVEIDFVPGNGGVVLEAGLALLTEGIDWRVEVLELTVCGVINDLRPGFVCFAESNGVGMAGPIASAMR